jgi:hypothetical protein
MVSFTSRPLYPPERSHRHPLDRRQGGSQSRSGRGGEKNLSAPAKNSTPVVQPVA